MQARVPLVASEGDEGGGGGGGDAASESGGGGGGATNAKHALNRARVLLVLLAELRATGVHTDAAALPCVSLDGGGSLLPRTGNSVPSPACFPACSSILLALLGCPRGSTAPPAPALRPAGSPPAPFSEPRDLSHLRQARAAGAATASAYGAAAAADKAADGGAAAVPSSTAGDPVAELAGGVSDAAARRAMRTLPLLLPLLRLVGEDLTGAPSRSIRTWLAGLPRELAAAWRDAHAGAEHDLSASAPRLVPAVVAPLALPTAVGGGEVPASVVAEPVAPPPASAAPVPAGAPPQSPLLPSLLFEPPVQAALTGALDAYYHAVARAASACTVFQSLPLPRSHPRSPPRFRPCSHPRAVLENADLRRLEKRADLLLFKKGVVPEKDAEALEEARASLEKVRAHPRIGSCPPVTSVHLLLLIILTQVRTAVGALADVLDRDPPPLDDALVDDDEEGGKAKGRLTLWLHGGSADEGGPFGDAVSRSFYEDTPDLRDTVPSILLGAALDAAAAAEGEGEAAEGGGAGGGSRAPGTAPRGARANVRTNARGTLDGALEQFSGRRAVAAAPAPAPAPAPAAAPAVTRPAPPAAAPALSPADADAADAAAATAALQQQPQLRLVDMLGRLGYCASRDAVDSWAADFVMLNYNTRANRDRLARLICEGEGAGAEAAALASGGGSGDADVLPYLARLVAVLSSGIKEFGPAVVELVSKDLMKALRPGACARWPGRGLGERGAFILWRSPSRSRRPGHPRRGRNGPPPPLRAPHRRADQVPRLRARARLRAHPPLHPRPPLCGRRRSALHAPRARRPLPLPHARDARGHAGGARAAALDARGAAPARGARGALRVTKGRAVEEGGAERPTLRLSASVGPARGGRARRRALRDGRLPRARQGPPRLARLRPLPPPQRARRGHGR